MIAMLGPKADTGAFTKPEPSLLRLPGRDLQPLAPPDPLDPLVVDQPAGLAQQGGDPAIAIAAVSARQFDDVGREPCLVIPAPRRLALCRAVLPSFVRLAPRIRDARRRQGAAAHARCERADARGSPVSRGGLLQDQLVQREVRHRPA